LVSAPADLNTIRRAGSSPCLRAGWAAQGAARAAGRGGRRGHGPTGDDRGRPYEPAKPGDLLGPPGELIRLYSMSDVCGRSKRLSPRP